MSANIQELRKFVAPEYLFGVGCRTLAGQYATSLGAQKILLVTDPGVKDSRWCQEVVASLEDEKLPYTIFSEITANPKDEEVMAGAEQFHSQQCNAIVAVGGGSPMDAAKGIGIVVSNHDHILTFEGVDQIAKPIPPLICIPTTGGTAADVSQFSIITDRARKTKIAIVSKKIVPDLALIDPETLTSMPHYLTACTGMDALTHAIEAYVSNAHSPMTDIHALEAVRLLVQHLPKTLDNPADLAARTEVMLGSLQAGLAFSNAILGAVHAMAHSLGGRLDLPHGECNSILLDHVIRYNLVAEPDRFDRIAEAMGIELDKRDRNERNLALLEGIDSMKKQVGITKGLADIGVGVNDIPELATNALSDPCMLTNPRTPNRRDIETIYEEAL